MLSCVYSLRTHGDLMKSGRLRKCGKMLTWYRFPKQLTNYHGSRHWAFWRLHWTTLVCLCFFESFEWLKVKLKLPFMQCPYSVFPIQVYPDHFSGSWPFLFHKTLCFRTAACSATFGGMQALSPAQPTPLSIKQPLLQRHWNQGHHQTG